MSDDNNWSLIIEPRRKLFDLRLRELVQYRDLVALFVKRDFVTQFKQTILGPLWFVINPLVSTIMYAFVFGNLAGIGTDGVPSILFYYAGTMLWTYFSACFTDSSNLFINNAGLFGKVYFPRLTVPVSNILFNLLKAAVQFALLLAFYIYFLIAKAPLAPSLSLLLFPLSFLWIAALGVGLGLIVSSLTTKYRDLRILVTFALSLGMYVTPVVYPLSEIPRGFAWLFYLNPLSAPIELFRVWFFGAGAVPPSMLISSIVSTLLIALLGMVMFNQNERNFIDVV